MIYSSVALIRSGEVCREGPGPQESVREVEREGAGAGGQRERE